MIPKFWLFGRYSSLDDCQCSQCTACLLVLIYRQRLYWMYVGDIFKAWKRHNEIAHESVNESDDLSSADHSDQGVRSLWNHQGAVPASDARQLLIERCLIWYSHSFRTVLSWRQTTKKLGIKSHRVPTCRWLSWSTWVWFYDLGLTKQVQLLVFQQTLDPRILHQQHTVCVL